MSLDNQELFDAVIVGGGMVGSALAVSLLHYFPENFRIAVVEAGEFFDEMPQPASNIQEVDARVSALSHASYRLFENLGAWQYLRDVACPYTHMDVWDGDGTGSIQFVAREQGQPQLGFLVENRFTTAAMHKVLASSKQASLFPATKLKSLARQDEGWLLETASGDSFHASLLVGADGARSWVRKQAGIESRQYEFHQQAIVTTVKTEKPHDRTARQRFLSTGPLAFLPMATTFDHEHISSIVWSLDEGEVESKLELDEVSFQEELGRAFEYQLGDIQQCSQRFAFPLVQSHARDYIRENLVLVGDAAHTVHPLAGQGVNLGFLDVATLAEEMNRSILRGGSLGERAALRRYERRRKANNQLMMNSFRGFKLLFGEKAMPVRWARNAGMSFLNDVKPVKNHMVQQAMGMTGDLPELVK